MNGRLVRKSLSYSRQVEMLKAASAWEDWAYNLTRLIKTLRMEVKDGLRRWQPRSPAMAAGLTDHIRTVKELLMTVVSLDVINTKLGRLPESEEGQIRWTAWPSSWIHRCAECENGWPESDLTIW